MNPFIMKIKDMPQPAQGQMRALIRGIVSSGIVQSDVGYEATEEIFEMLLDNGKVKISIEPICAEGGVQLLMFDDRLHAYRVLKTLTIKNMAPPMKPFMDNNAPGIIIDGA